MSTATDPVRLARTGVANASKRGEDLAPYRQRLAAAWVEREITRATAGPHAITTEQRRALADMLVGGSK